MNAIIIIINLSAFILTAIAGYRVGSRCGFPGLPHDTLATPSKLIYEDGEEVMYSCPMDKMYLKTQVKRCEAGSWVGKRSTCGLFIANQLMSVQIVYLESGAVVFDGPTNNYTNTDYPTSFYDRDASNVMVPNADSPRKWYFTFKSRQSFDFFLLILKIPNTKFGDSNLIDKIRVKNVTVESAPDRNCQLDFSTRRHSTKIFWFWCANSANTSGDEEADRISLVTSATEPIGTLGLHQLYFTKLFYCGQPELSLLAEFIDGRVQCDSRLSEPRLKSAESLVESYDDYEHCSDNPYWAGKPECLPKRFCSLDFDHKTEEIVSVRNAYKLNETEWYAIEGTVIEFGCKSGYELFDGAKKVCGHDFKWDFEGPVCGHSKSLNPSAILVIVGILIILVPIVV